MATTGFPKIEDIVEELSTDLDQIGFSRVAPQKDERVRYTKRDSLTGFQVGIEEYDDLEKEPEFHCIYLALGYNLPEGASGQDGERMLPSSDLMRTFFKNSLIQGLCADKDTCLDGRMNLFYRLGFEKDTTSSREMKAALREIVDYMGNYVDTNAQMMERTQSFRE